MSDSLSRPVQPLEIAQGREQLLNPVTERMEAGDTLGRAVLRAGTCGQFALGTAVAELLLSGGQFGERERG